MLPLKLKIVMFLFANGDEITEFAKEQIAESLAFAKARYEDGKQIYEKLFAEFAGQSIAMDASSIAKMAADYDITPDVAARCRHIASVSGQSPEDVFAEIFEAVVRTPQLVRELIAGNAPPPSLTRVTEYGSGPLKWDEEPSMCTLPPDLKVGASQSTAEDLWHLPKEKWDRIRKKVTGKGVVVAVLDTGYTPHPDLPDPIAEKSFIPGEPVKDDNGHGCHCIGTSVGRNGIGVANEADLIVGKVLSNAGSGSSQGIADAVIWAVDQGADVISLSIGGGGFYGPMQKALQYAWDHGVVVVAAAGNSGFNGANSIDFPGKYFESICVGAYRSDGEIARFSSGGREIDIACEGQDIVSASHEGSGYVSMSGTSMATPRAAGLIADIIELQRREKHPEFSGVEAVRSFLAEYTHDAGEVGEDDRFGLGIPSDDKIVDSLDNDELTAMTTAV